MLTITCPYCGARDEIEFSYVGEAHITRPEAPENLSDAEWADYLFNRRNTKGGFLEQWQHVAGCRQFFNVARDTTNNHIFLTYKIGEDLGGIFLDNLDKEKISKQSFTNKAEY